MVYRKFDAAAPSAFPNYERLHQRRISFVVGPLFAALVPSVGSLGIDRPAAVPLWTALASGGIVAPILAMTAFAAVPLHARLSSAGDRGVHRRLLRVDLAPSLAATAAG